ncbi:hypothetical protein NESM_000765500 [Novymonas esmeraldas]|uniref:Uncharacterized protein n=1 Tax=Novymonas esmeraldas TaxID=1808958 RepID=A0AAW0EZ55_9TRYP
MIIMMRDNTAYHTAYTMNHARYMIGSESPMISIASRMRSSFSTTMRFVCCDTGYRNPSTTISGASDEPYVRKELVENATVGIAV